MDFELTNRQKQIRLAAREFAEGELAPLGKDCEAKGEYPREIIKKAAQLSFVGVYIKKEYGGLGLGTLEHSIILEEFWRAEPGLGQVFSQTTLVPELLFCSEEQKKNIFRLGQGTGLWVLPSPSLGLGRCGLCHHQS
jgi:alkylation response protein AidB-like acyl-CoA dehydrogenase